MQLIWFFMFALLLAGFLVLGAGFAADGVHRQAPNVQICNPGCNWVTPTPMWPGQ